MTTPEPTWHPEPVTNRNTPPATVTQLPRPTCPGPADVRPLNGWICTRDAGHAGPCTLRQAAG